MPIKPLSVAKLPKINPQVKRKDSSKIFTVVGLYEDNAQRFCTSVEADTAKIAEENVLEEFPDVTICASFLGKHAVADKETYVRR